MATIFAEQARLKSGWASNVRLKINQGCIAGIETDAVPQPADFRVDTLLPAPGNLHSHSFQRAMAGMTEYRAAGKDDFWSWRELMYRFVYNLTPDHIQAFAALTFMEMQEAGYASVGEFHYVHHQPDGTPYGDISELSQQIFAAAADTGIGLTHLPVLYSYGGAGKFDLVGGQIRFGNDVERFARLVSALQSGLAALAGDARLGIAPHSLRATCPEDLQALLVEYRDRPVHVHIAEQPKEVDEITGWLGARPVAWLLDNHDIDPRWCLIHATHMTEKETIDLAKTGAVVGLCPITESNLGDGIFNGAKYLQSGGYFGIGSDSNIRVSMIEELRTLEYSQRLRDRSRNIMVPGDGSVGETLYMNAAIGAAQALDRPAGEIAEGRLADLLAIDSDAPALCALTKDQLLDGLCFAAGGDVVTDLWSAGRHQVSGGRHVNRDRIIRNYRKAVGDLLGLI